MMAEPLVSVVIPVYNMELFLEETVRSVLASSYPAIEVILMDDGSTDGSSELCDDFARRDSRVRVLHRPNDGLSVARNAGLAVATGDYVGFVDGDDWIEADMYECLYGLLAGCDADIAACSHFRDKGERSTASHATGRTFVYSRDEALAQLAEDKRIRNYAVDKLYRRSLFEDIAFPPSRYFEDIAVMCRLFAKARAVVFREVPKYHYCVRQGSIMQGRYNPLKEYHFFLGLYEQYVFLRAECPAVDTSVQVVRRGLHLLEHLYLAPVTPETERIRQQVLLRLHEHDALGMSRLGFATVLKRGAIYHVPGCYAWVYRLFRGLFKSKRHRF